jgi:hypothetical protein
VSLQTGVTEGRFKEVTMIKMMNSFSMTLTGYGGSDVKTRGSIAYVVLEFEGLNGNTGEDGNLLFYVYFDSAEDYKLKVAPDNAALAGQIHNLKFVGPKNNWQFQWYQ